MRHRVSRALPATCIMRLNSFGVSFRRNPRRGYLGRPAQCPDVLPMWGVQPRSQLSPQGIGTVHQHDNTAGLLRCDKCRAGQAAEPGKREHDIWRYPAMLFVLEPMARVLHEDDARAALVGRRVNQCIHFASVSLLRRAGSTGSCWSLSSAARSVRPTL